MAIKIHIPEEDLLNRYMREDAPVSGVLDIQYCMVGVDKKGRLTKPPEKWATCKDYLTDGISTYHVEPDRRIESWAWAHYDGKLTMPEDGSYIIMHTTRPDVIKKGIKRWLNPIEEEAGIEPTEVHSTDHSRMLLIRGDRMIFGNTALAALWFMIIRTCWYQAMDKVVAHKDYAKYIAQFTPERDPETFLIKNGTGVQVKDSPYLKTIINNTDTSKFFVSFFSLAEDLYRDKKEYAKHIKNFGTTHGSGGIQTLVNSLVSGGVTGSPARLMGESRWKLLKQTLPWNQAVLDAHNTEKERVKKREALIKHGAHSDTTGGTQGTTGTTPRPGEWLTMRGNTQLHHEEEHFFLDQRTGMVMRGHPSPEQQQQRQRDIEEWHRRLSEVQRANRPIAARSRNNNAAPGPGRTTLRENRIEAINRALNARGLTARQRIQLLDTQQRLLEEQRRGL